MTATTRSVLEHRIGADGLLSIALSGGEARLRGIGGDTLRITDRRGRDLHDLFAIDLGDGSASVRTSGGPGRRGGSPDIEVELPRSATVVVEQSNGDIDADGLDGDQRYRSASGDLRVRGAGGSITIESASGDVDVVASSAADVNLRTLSGDVELRAATLRSLQVATTSGDLRLAGHFAGPGPYAIETVSGDALLAPAGDLRIALATISGDLQSEMGGRVQRDHGRQSLTIGSGGTTLEVRSMSGDVTIVRPRTYEQVETEVARATAGVERPVAFEDDVPDPDSPPDPDAIVVVDLPALTATGDEPGTIANGALAAAYDEARLRILQSLEQGTIDVVEAGRRLEALDAGGPVDPLPDAETARFETGRTADRGGAAASDGDDARA